MEICFYFKLNILIILTFVIERHHMKTLAAVLLGTVVSFGSMSASAQTSRGQQKKVKKQTRENTLKDTSGSSSADTSGSKTQPGGKRDQPATLTTDTTGKQPQR